ncbi:hypothetical protein AB0K00_44895 [Dactylosporangium sp. NPDC049525]|uniref:effector-associated domain 2-containing protein n=1 Tax=Dactylosporangium sp. NPDC049525 TaxID=3154730 RepID=UPI0034495C5E
MSEARTGLRCLVVAVERYDIGADWSLDGPVPDAVRFVEWLLDRGVPRSAITLVASPLPKNEPLLAKLGLPWRPAGQAVVYDIVTKELPAGRDDLLIVFWGGHGVVDGDGNRRLFAGDATRGDKRNLDFDSLCQALLTPYFPAHRRQLLLVDACQNLTSDLQFVPRLPRQTFPDEPGLVHGREQHVLFAASPGEAALNDSVRQTGVFSRELLAALRASTTWPPDAGELADLLQQRFEALRTAGVTEQRPAYLWQRTPTRDGVVHHRPAAASPAPPVGRDGVLAIVTVMAECRELASIPNLQKIISFMTADIRNAVPHSDHPRMYLAQLVQTCAGYPAGRAELSDALRLGMSNRADLALVMAAFDRHWPNRS